MNMKEILTTYAYCFQLTPKHIYADRLIGAEDDDSIVDNNEIDTNNNLDSDWALTIPKTYRNNELRKWRPAPIVPDIYGRPGEMGKPVKIPADQEALMKEKFKENQFNLMASDMISLNRSLTDVRNPK